MSFRVLCFSVGLTSVIGKDSSSGDARCPCLQEAPAALDTGCANLVPSHMPSGDCYPADYGFGRCAAHDAGLSPYCSGPAPSQPSFCQAKWCFVDAVACRYSPFAHSLSSASVRVASKGEEHVSYYTSSATCDESDAFEEASSSSSDAFSGRALRLSAVGFSTYPGTFKANASDYYDDDVPFAGAMVDFATYLIETAGGSVERVYAGSVAASTVLDAHTALCSDVANGLTDVGVSGLYASAGRLEYARRVRESAPSSARGGHRGSDS